MCMISSIFGGRFVGTPRVGVSASASGRDLSVGWRLAPEAAAAPGPTLGVEAACREGGAAGAEHGVRIEASAQW